MPNSYSAAARSRWVRRPHRRGVTAAIGALLMLAATVVSVASCAGRDTPARYGGEEFVVLLPGTNEAGALSVAERIRASLEASAIPAPTGPIRVTASIGLSVITGPGCMERGATLFAQADGALYSAKNAGRNRIVAAR